MDSMEWDKKEMFAAPNGVIAVRYAISDRDGVAIEFSMHDPTIQSMFPRDYWLPVFTALTNNVRINRIDGKCVVLCGFGKPNDPLGNLILFRLSSKAGFSGARMGRIVAQIIITLDRFGIRFDKHMADTIRGN